MNKSLRRMHLVTSMPYIANIIPDKPHDGVVPRRKKKAREAMTKPIATTLLYRLYP
jgi:hypothetical protein